MKIAHVGAAALLLLVGCDEPRVAERGALGVPWTFMILDTQRKTVGTLGVRFTAEKAQSCISGDWRKIVVVSFKSLGEPAFPGKDPLAYSLEGRQLTIGRNEICDGYVMLQGELTDAGLSGEYFTLGLGGQHQMGYVLGKPSE